MAGLIEANARHYGNKEHKNYISQNAIGRYYAKWVKSEPFDIGSTTSKAFGKLVNLPYAHTAKHHSKEKNQDSVSNGSMMRCTPMAVWSSSLQSDKDVFDAVRCDVEFTHPNRLVQEAVFIYVRAIKYLLNNP